MVKIISFQDALSAAQSANKRHILLGNGFCRAWRDDIFSYAQLFDRADFSSLSEEARKAFDVLATTDFEVVMEGLKRASRLVKLYSQKNSKLVNDFDRDADGLREVLVSAIADSHPERPNDIAPVTYKSCKTFLSNFDDIYTINYDLLLYWALMNEEIQPEIRCDDGFRQPDDGPQPWVSWDSSAHGQNVFYLHGALHIYEAAAEIQKYTWSNTQIALIDQIRAALKEEKYPLFVAEGSSEQKMAKIIRSSFLGRAYRSFENIGGTLFVYGLSMADSDAHILKAITHSKVEALYASVYGKPTSKDNRRMIERAESLVTERQSSRTRKLSVCFYDAQSANVWGK